MTVQSLKRKTKQSVAIDTAKKLWRRIPSEPLIPDDFVLLREIMRANVVLTHKPPNELPINSPAQHQKVLDALLDGSLVARTSATGTIIPQNCWPSNTYQGHPDSRGEDDVDAEDNGFWCGEISFDHQCKGFVGQLPVVPRREAETWLKDAVGQTAKPGRPLEQERTKKIYGQLFPNGHEANGTKSKAEACRLVSAEYQIRHGKPISATTVFRAQGWKK